MTPRILASALAICEESTLRSVAANMGVELESVHVEKLELSGLRIRLSPIV